jgi:hypothetical protein
MRLTTLDTGAFFQRHEKNFKKGRRPLASARKMRDIWVG